MSLTSPLLILVFIWAAIHATFYFIRPAKSQSILPFSRSSTRIKLFTDTPTQITLKSFHLRVQTTAYNLAHDIFSASLRNPARPTLAPLVKHFYDVGSVVALIGMCLVLGFLVLTGGTSTASLARKFLTTADPSKADILDTLVNRRSLEVPESEYWQSSSWIQPIIPGVTVPLSHLPIILFAVLFAQIAHEAGHAIAAAADALPISSVGISFTLVIPSAFVSFSSTTLQNLSPRARARISAAGTFHNIILWLLLLFVAYTGLGGVVWSFAYRDVSDMGRVVISVDPGSPLLGYLPSGSLITGLDDTIFSLPNSSDDAWTSYLHHANKERSNLGWCTQLEGTNESCCKTASHNDTVGLSCFVAVGEPSTRGCVDPIPILTSTSTSTSINATNVIQRCASTLDCSNGAVCSQPSKSEKFLRLTVHRKPSRDSKPEVIVWSGPTEEIWEEVQVDTLLPRFPFIPVSLPSLARTFWEYVSMATLSLYFFNLLPLPFLDGSQFLSAAAQMVWDDDISDQHQRLDEYELERQQTTGSSQSDSRKRFWRKRIVNRFIPRLTFGVLVTCIVLGIGNAYW